MRVPRCRGLGAWARTTLLAASATLSGCYYHGMAGPALATAGSDRAGAVVTGSTGINGKLGGVGLNASGTVLDGQYSGMLGVEAFRLWRGDPETGFQPYVRGALGALELGIDDGDFLWGGLSPRGEAGLMWLDDDLKGFTLGVAAEYRLRADGRSTPVFLLQLGFGGFDYVDSSSKGARTEPKRSLAVGRPRSPDRR